MNRFITTAVALVVLSLSAGCSRHEPSSDLSKKDPAEPTAPSVASATQESGHASHTADGAHEADQEHSTESTGHHAGEAEHDADETHKGQEHGGHEHAASGKHAQALPAGANQMCPVMPEEKVDPSVFVEFNGKRIYVCCKKCRQRVADDPAAWYAKAYGAGHKN